MINIHPEPFDEQLKLIRMFMKAKFLERGERVFQCWHHVDDAMGRGAWMLVFYECFGFIIFHSKGQELRSTKSKR